MAEYIVYYSVEDTDELMPYKRERIVRCRDCKYQRDCYCDHPKGSYMNAVLPVEPNGFCAWGEAKVVE